MDVLIPQFQAQMHLPQNKQLKKQPVIINTISTCYTPYRFAVAFLRGNATVMLPAIETNMTNHGGL